MREKTYKQIEASRNRRLWITTVVLPVVSMGALMFSTVYNNNLEFRYNVNTAVNDAHKWVKEKFNKKK